jgi:recombination protein RecA
MDDQSLLDLEKRLRKTLGENYTGLGQSPSPIEVTSTLMPGLDMALGGGIPRGRIIEVYGQFSSGKTTLAMYFIKLYQQLGRTCALVDAESAFNPHYAQLLGIDTEKLLLLESNSAETVLNILKDIVTSGIELIVVDSVAALTTNQEMEKEIGENTVASLARLMSTGLKQIVPGCAESGTTVLFINQVRAANLGGYGPTKDTAGGNALKFYASQRISVTKKETLLRKSGEPYGIISTVKMEKNKIGMPFRKADITIFLPSEDSTGSDYGVDAATDLIEYAVRYQIISKGGAWYTYGDFKCQGFDSLRTAIIERGWITELKEKIDAQEPQKNDN